MTSDSLQDKNRDATFQYYLTYDVENRVKKDQAHRIEYIMTRSVLDELFESLEQCTAIFADIGCGTGNYTVEYAPKAAHVYACDLMPNLLEQLREKAKQRMCSNIETICTSADHLATIKDQSCDIVLCMGPLYHLCEDLSRKKAINECIRIAKPGCRIVFTYLNTRALWANIARGKMTVQEFSEIETLERILYPPFYLMTPCSIEEELKQYPLHIQSHIALDAFSSFMLDDVNRWSDVEYQSWIRIAKRHSQEAAWLEFSSHNLIVAEVR